MVEKSSTKLLYTMGEVAEMFDVNPSLLRYWEKNFSILKPQKNKKGNRLFTAKDIENLKVIYHLIRERGMTIDGAKRQLKQSRVEVDRDTAIMERLETIRAMLLQIKNEFKESADAGEVEIEIDQTAIDRKLEEQVPENESMPTIQDLFGELPPPAPPTEVENLNPNSIHEFDRMHNEKIKSKIMSVDLPPNPSLFDQERVADTNADSEQKQSSLF
ncbi:MAG: MerR family transcriptional regulator [Rikenellaceae bacterium]|nr:MerR family transcriptional regulator [Rikenellaceae bacterium]